MMASWIVLAAAAAGCAGGRPDMRNDIVTTTAGPVRGVVTESHRRFQGIPYAAPPVGERRWSAPAPVLPWTDVLDATRPASACPQAPTAYAAGVDAGSEDCLFLNLTTPRAGTGGHLAPVMVWIHGDGAVGSGSLFDARRLAADGGVVVVTINYRLGIFGGFGYPGLAGSGTFGLQDQQAALGWVRDNIASFGGDPGNVTVFGESYGGLSTTAHLVSPPARGLFHRAIVQSGLALLDLPAGAVFPGLDALPSWGWRSTEETEALGVHVAGLLGCAGAGRGVPCLRQVPVKDLLPHTQMFMAHAYGNALLPENPADALRGGRSHPVPVISGATRHEHRLFVGLFYELAGQPVTAETYPALLAAAFGRSAAAIAAEYPLSASPSPGVAWADVLTDRVWALHTLDQHAALARRAPVYAYEFADEAAPMYLPFPPSFPAGAYHAADVPYLFPDDQAESTFSPAQRALAGQMTRYWTRFAHSGDPNAKGLPAWPRFAGPADVLSLAPGTNGIRTADYAATHRLTFWANLHREAP
jgi:para-nitrobenzyl esterase